MIGNTYKNTLYFLNCNKRVFDVFEAILREKNDDAMSLSQEKATVNTLKTLFQDPSDFSGGKKSGTLFVSAILALAKKTDSIWSLFTESEKKEFDDIVKFIAYSVSLISNDGNDYHTSLNMEGNIRKYWNPNNRTQVILPIVFCMDYFGQQELDNILSNFDYDEAIETLKNNGWTKAIASWTTPGIETPNRVYSSAEEMLCGKDGGAAEPGATKGKNKFSAGSGIGIKRPYTYKDSNNAEFILNDVIGLCFNGGNVVSAIDYNLDYDIDAYILDKSVSPFEGIDGMIYEFNAKDNGGFRSDIRYAYDVYCDSIMALLAAKSLGIIGESYDIGKIDVGLEDFVYKARHGYRCFSNGNGYDIYPSETANAEILKYKELFYEYMK